MTTFPGYIEYDYVLCQIVVDESFYAMVHKYSMCLVMGLICIRTSLLNYHSKTST